MDPFRDELAAAQAKIAQLEEQVQRLEHAAQRNAPPSAESRLSGNALVFIMIVVLMLIGAGASVLLFDRTSVSHTDPSFRGVATAVAAQSEAAPPVVQPGSIATTTAPTVDAKPCRCQVGDPLCSCL